MQDQTYGILEEAKGASWAAALGAPLPWVNQLKHLWNNISNNVDGNQLGMKIKNTKYIDKNNSLCQEFHFTHPENKVQLNNIFNNHYTGSQLWKLDSKGFEKTEETYYRLIKIMNDVPFATHRFLIEPISGTPHMSRTPVRRYLTFIEKIQISKILALRHLLDIAQSDVRTTTGANLRFIMLLTEKNRIGDLKAGNVDFEYHTINEADEWKIDFVKELIDVKNDNLNVAGMDFDEIEEISCNSCTKTGV